MLSLSLTWLSAQSDPRYIDLDRAGLQAELTKVLQAARLENRSLVIDSTVQVEEAKEGKLESLGESKVRFRFCGGLSKVDYRISYRPMFSKVHGTGTRLLVEEDAMLKDNLGLTVQHRWKALGNPEWIEDGRAVVLEDYDYLDAACCYPFYTVLDYTTYGIRFGGEGGILGMLGNRKRYPGLEASEHEVDGDTLLTLTFRDRKRNPCTIDTITLNRSKGFALVERTQAINLCTRNPVSYKVAVHLMTEVKPLGVFFPKDATYELAELDGTVTRRKRFFVNQIQIEEGADHELTVPLGYHVHDERLGISFVAGESPEDLLQNVRRSIPKENAK